MQAQFITLDGIDGAGKSTNLNVIRNWFDKRRLPVLFTREPGGTPLGEALREILLNPATQAGLRTETLLMFAARQQHIENVILPALKSGVHVVSDRFTDATYAYQVGGRGLDEKRFAALERWVHPHLQPDLTVIFDLDPQVAASRLAGTGNAPDRFEREQADFFERVRNAYLRRAAADPARVKVIDAGQRPEEIRKELEQIILENCFQ